MGITCVRAMTGLSCTPVPRSFLSIKKRTHHKTEQLMGWFTPEFNEWVYPGRRPLIYPHQRLPWFPDFLGAF